MMRNNKAMGAGETPAFFIFINDNVFSLKKTFHQTGIFCCTVALLFLPLALELLDTSVVLSGNKSERDDAGNVHLGAEDVHVEAELDADSLDILETLLVVGAGATDPDLDFVLDEERGDLAESANDSLESGGDLLQLC